MKLSAVLVSLSAAVALAAPQNDVQTWNTCLITAKRKEWRNLSTIEKSMYSLGCPISYPIQHLALPCSKLRTDSR